MPKSPQWNGWSPSLTNSRFQDATAAGLTASDVPKLKLKWAFNLGDITMARAQPVVVGSRMFITSLTGAVYSPRRQYRLFTLGIPGRHRSTSRAWLSARTMANPRSSSATRAQPSTHSTPRAANCSGRSGALATVHFTAMPTATPLFYKGVVYQAYSSFEEAIAGDPTYQCCSARVEVSWRSTILRRARRTIWQTFTIADEAKPTRKPHPALSISAPPEPESGPRRPSTSNKVSPLRRDRRQLFRSAHRNQRRNPRHGSLQTGKLLWSGNSFDRKRCLYQRLQYPAVDQLPRSARSRFRLRPVADPRASRRRQARARHRPEVRHGARHRSRRQRKDPLADPRRRRQRPRRQPMGLGFRRPEGLCRHLRYRHRAVAYPTPPSLRASVSRSTRRKAVDSHALDLNTGKIAWSTKPIPCPETRTDCSPAQSARRDRHTGRKFSPAP